MAPTERVKIFPQKIFSGKQKKRDMKDTKNTKVCKYVEYNFFGSQPPQLVFTPRKSFRARQRRARAILGAAGALRVRLASDCSKNGIKMVFGVILVSSPRWLFTHEVIYRGI